MSDLLDVLQERGFIEQVTHTDALATAMAAGSMTGYIGFDPTASSLHVGSLVPIMALAHMQRCGHRPIALIGGGTGLVGDPSGKTEMRQLLAPEDVIENAAGIKKQLSRFITFDHDRALLLNNADWLTSLEYIPFLRDIGRHFSVNRMIKAESYRVRLDSEEGLNFVEFNYMLLQAYDFLVLHDQKGCLLQMGGSDQWGNIVAGIDLVRRMRQRQAYGITFPLITTSSGAKMGKTAKGAVWLDADRTSPYEYFQFWVNTDDHDVARFLALFTFLPMKQIQAVTQMSGVDINNAKAILAFEATALAHGATAAAECYQAAMAMFGIRPVTRDLLPDSTIHQLHLNSSETAVPQTIWSEVQLIPGRPAYQLFHETGLTASGSAARRLIQQGGAYINGCRINAVDEMITLAYLKEGQILLRAGKKKFHQILIR